MDAHKGSRTVLALQIAALILIHGVVGAAAYRQFAKGARARNNTIALSFSAKSIIIILYEILTEHVQAFRRWKSLKAYMILSCMEVVFWIAVPVLMIMAWVKDHWKGTTAILGGVIVGLGCAVAFLYVILAFIAIRRWKGEKQASAHARLIQGQASPDEEK